VASAGDFNGDGVPDVGVHHQNYYYGRILVYSGQTGYLIKRFASGGMAFESPVRAGDVNGDGREEYCCCVFLMGGSFLRVAASLRPRVLLPAFS
jgi:hypothetical protein